MGGQQASHAGEMEQGEVRACHGGGGMVGCLPRPFRQEVSSPPWMACLSAPSSPFVPFYLTNLCSHSTLLLPPLPSELRGTSGLLGGGGAESARSVAFMSVSGPGGQAFLPSFVSTTWTDSCAPRDTWNFLLTSTCL